MTAVRQQTAIRTHPAVVLAHFAVMCAVFYLIWRLTRGYPLLQLTLLFTHLTTICVTILYHRNETHQSIWLHPLAKHPMRAWAWLTTAMKIKEWVAVHRCHHAHVDTPEDPHSPVFYGIGRVFFWGAPLYHVAASDKALLAEYGKGTPDDFLERYVYTVARGLLGVILLLAFETWRWGWWAGLTWPPQMLWIPLVAAGIINGVGHHWGYRNIDTRDASRNIGFPLRWGWQGIGVVLTWALAFITVGESLHNNHHAQQGSANFSRHWWEIDPGYVYIRILVWLGLAEIRRDRSPLAAT